MKTLNRDPWQVSAGDFPREGTVAEQWRYLLQYAVLAPSSRNTQPWLFHVRYTLLDLYADRRHACPIADPHDRELTMSCGCALFNLRCALGHFRYLGAVDLLPESHPDLLARVHLGTQGYARSEDEKLFAAITARRTNRQPFDDRAVPEALLKALQSAAAAEGAWLEIVSGEQARAAVGELVAEGDRRQWSDLAFRRELARWLRTDGSNQVDGIPEFAVGIDDLLSDAGPVAVRTFNMGAGAAARDQEIALGSPALVVLGTAGDTTTDWLAAGQALERVLLRARVDNVWASFLNQPIEIPALRNQLAALLKQRGHPQTVLRLGYGEAIKPTPRRPVEVVMM